MEYKLASTTWDEREYAALSNVIESGHFSMGERVLEYETAFSKYNGSNYTVMVGSGSSANLLMIAALFYTSNPKYRLKAGDEVIVPAVSWSTTYFPLQQYGLKVVFVDVDRGTLNIELDALKEAITPRTRLIFAVNLLGNPNNYDEINEIIADKDIVLIEDNCESLGAEFGGKKAGTFGVMGSYSSFYSHHIATMEGGCITTDDEELYHVLLSLRAHGWTRNLPKKNWVTGLKSDDWFDESFKFVLPGYNVRPLEMSGAVGIEQLKKLPEFIRARRENARYFIETFKDLEFVEIQEEIGQSSWFGFSLILKEQNEISRRDVVELLTRNSIDCRPIVSGNFLKNQSVLQHFNYEVRGSVENAEYLDAQGLFVGNHQVCIKPQIDHLAMVMARFR